MTPARGRKHGADTEDERVEPAHVDTERRNHLAVRGAGPDQHTEARARGEPGEEKGDRQAQHDDRQAVGWIGDARQNFDRAGEPGGPVEEQGARPPDDAHQLVEEENQAEGGEHLVQVIALVEPAQGDQLDEHADQRRRRQRDHQASRNEPVAPATDAATKAPTM